MNKNGKIFIIIILILLVGFVIMASDQDTQKAQNEPIKIGASLVMTGPNGYTGDEYVLGLQLAQEEINAAGGIHGRALELIVEDNKSDSSEGVLNFRALQLRNIDLMLSISSAASVAISPLALEAGLPLFVSIAFADVTASNPNAVSFFPRPQDDVKASLQDMESASIKTVGVLYMNAEYGKAGLDAFIEEAKNIPVSVIDQEAFSADLSDFETPLLKLAQSNPDAIYIIGTNIAPMINQLKAQHPEIEIYANLVPVFGNLVYKDPEVFDGVHVTAPPVALSGMLAYQEFRDKIGDRLDTVASGLGYVSTGYDNMYAIAEVLRANSNVPEFVDTFANYGTFNSVNGSVDFDGRKVGMKLYPAIFEDGVLRQVIDQ